MGRGGGIADSITGGGLALARDDCVAGSGGFCTADVAVIVLNGAGAAAGGGFFLNGDTNGGGSKSSSSNAGGTSRGSGT